MNRIYVLGSINMDLVFSVDRIPNQGETLNSNDFFMTPGGKGANQAVACAKQMIDTWFIGSLGDDGLSSVCKQSLLRYHVNCTHLMEIPNHTCGIAGILLEHNDNRILIHGGANDIHDRTRIQSILNQPEVKDSILIVQLEIPMNIVETACITAKKQNMMTLLNAAPAKVLSDTLYKHIDLLIVNELETYTLTNINIEDADSMKRAAKVLLNKGVQAVLITNGDKGSTYFNNVTTIHVEAHKVNVVDTTAAGDTYIGVLASQIATGVAMNEAMLQATAGAALTIQQNGAQISIPSKQEIDAFRKEQKEGCL